MSDVELKRIVNDLVSSTIAKRFPRNIGSSSGEQAKTANPEAQKFSVFIIKGRKAGNVKYDKGYVALPFPEVNDSVNVSYSDTELGVQGAAALGSLNGNLTGNLSDFSHILKTGLSSFNVQAFTRVGADVATRAFPGLKASLVNGLGTIQNPYVTNVFKNVGFRTFSFSYNLVAKDAEDSDEINDIVKVFKKSMLPKNIIRKTQKGPGGVVVEEPTGLQQLPDLFEIRFYPTTKNYTQKSSTEAFVKIQEAVLTNVEVSYFSDTGGPVFFEGTNAPVGVKMSLTFQETSIYTRERCEAEFDAVIKENF